ncbi:ankyrin repeat domain-containing protein [Dactylosporangium darangshiense]|uniref:Ankyrin repeat domain-containing protein n=1 Tax=Dactylosporangium darangshiense TaxID=579108 RepID=A0ABP8DI49_9ACTN
MPTLPERPDLQRLRRQARDLQRAVRAGDPDALARVAAHHPGATDPETAPLPHAETAPVRPAAGNAAFPLAAAQLVVAREYGFASWPRLRRYLGTVAEHGWDSASAGVADPDPAGEFCRLACLTYTRDDGPERWAAARRLLAEHPGLTREHIWAAAAAARPGDVLRLLGEEPARASARGGPLRWRPLYYLAYSRAGGTEEDVLAVADALLAAGAAADDGYLFDGLPYPFTALTGVLGEGELGPARQPRHPHWRALAGRLLAAGADPNDAQGLYNTMFSGSVEHLEVLFAHGLGRPRRDAWQARVGDLIPSPAGLLRIQLRWAVEHDQRERVRLLAGHGVDVRSPFTGDGPAWAPGDGRTPVELARLYGHTQIEAELLAHGAPPPPPDPVAELIAAAFRADRPAVEALAARHPGVVDQARAQRPGLIVWAAARAPAQTVELLAGLGFDVNALGRADAPVEQEWETALHHSAGAGDVELTRRLLALGADPAARDRRFGATPLDWARHLGQPATAELLAEP